MSNDIDKALENLSAIKAGDDPRETNEESESVTAPSPEPDARARPVNAAGPLSAFRQEVDRLWREYDLEDWLPRDRLHTTVVGWEARGGLCKYNKIVDGDRFDKRVPDSAVRHASGSYTVLVSTLMWEANKEKFLDTVRHEVAHALAHVKHSKYPSRQRDYDYDPHYSAHGWAWKEVTRHIGAEPSACHREQLADGDYIYGCPNGCWKTDKKRRSKKVQRPWSKGRYCKTCDATPAACDRGKDITDLEPGEVDVDTIPWSNRTEYMSHPTKSLQ